MRKIYIQKIGVYIIILIGFFESLIQFISGRSLWLDESFLALNIIHKTPKELLKPLGYNQVAPALFLQVEWFFTQVFSRTDFALRFFPLLCFWCSMVLFYNILNIFFQKKIYITAVGMSLFAFNSTLLYYSSEIKQYICDVFVLLLLYFIALKKYKIESRRYILLLLVGSVCIFLSNVTPIILFTIFVYLFYNHVFKQKANVKYAIATGSVWCVFFLVYYYCFIYNHPTKSIMVAYWTNANAFMPIDKSIFSWFVAKYSDVFFFAFSFGNRIGVIISLLYGLGIFSLFRLKKYEFAILLLLPIFLHLVLSGLKMYPFEPRLYLYFCPFIGIVCCLALEYINGFFPKKYMLISLYIAIPFLLLRVIVIHPFPLIQHEDVKDCIKEMNRRIINTDVVYVTNLQGPPFKFYKDIKYLTSNITIVYGKYFEGYTENDYNVKKLNSLNGRVWVISQNNKTQEDRFIMHYLDSVGYKKIYGFTSIGGTNANLYKLPERFNH